MGCCQKENLRRLIYMLLRLSKNTFVRQFGDFTYIISRIASYDQMFEGGEAL